METIVEKAVDFKNEGEKGIDTPKLGFLSTDTRPFSLEFSSREKLSPKIRGNRSETRFVHPDSNRKTVRFLIRNP